MGQCHIVTVGRDADGNYRWEERPGLVRRRIKRRESSEGVPCLWGYAKDHRRLRIGSETRGGDALLPGMMVFDGSLELDSDAPSCARGIQPPKRTARDKPHVERME
jgi:hypothetical protein